MDRLDNAPWLFEASVQRVFAAIEQDGDQARAVGGAVRNAILGVPVSDIDIATTARPEAVLERARDAGLKAIGTGIDHGTVTIVSAGAPYEVTTLREDVETFGRQARVVFGTDWERDARRRDFTMNALYVDRHGDLFDPLGGLEDCRSGRVRFIGDAEQRIREDYLRILRFFRIHAAYGSGVPDEDALIACTHQRDGLRHLSAERVGAEMKKLASARGAAQSVQIMEDCGLLEITTGGISRTRDFAALRSLDDQAPETSEPPLCFAMLAGFVDEDLTRIGERFRLSNAEKKRMHQALQAARWFQNHWPEAGLEHALHDHGRKAAVDGLLMAWAYERANAQVWESDSGFIEALSALRELAVPDFPIAGADLLALGVKPGPDVGVALNSLRQAWKASGYRLSKADLIGVAAGSLRPSL
ncbi:CCA tRNA nucleotidyltransferase [Roseibium sp. RKSG952]|uniref:CCA tRNA nucleotidyltransferase n=1 Tax=Roseibium sp. RKSG952 TaxID=2529384 RepID=UPI0012BB985B|nr:CCA tRNA nucleotidyltransferase [Roseibium sp. RKSG952]MTH98413.1 CCA tRNA nucleotidyltransferase [Roseibium sp. RKSG952]